MTMTNVEVATANLTDGTTGQLIRLYCRYAQANFPEGIKTLPQSVFDDIVADPCMGTELPVLPEEDMSPLPVLGEVRGMVMFVNNTTGKIDHIIEVANVGYYSSASRVTAFSDALVVKLAATYAEPVSKGELGTHRISFHVCRSR